MGQFINNLASLKKHRGIVLLFIFGKLRFEIPYFKQHNKLDLIV